MCINICILYSIIHSNVVWVESYVVYSVSKQNITNERTLVNRGANGEIIGTVIVLLFMDQLTHKQLIAQALVITSLLKF